MAETARPHQPNPWNPERDVLALAVLGKMGEELNEAGSATARCIIQGINESEPVTGKPNREWLEDELADVFATARIAIEHFGLDDARIHDRANAKIRYLKGWHAMFPAPGCTCSDPMVIGCPVHDEARRRG